VATDILGKSGRAMLDARAQKGARRSQALIVACWHMLTTGELYNDLGGDYLHRRDPDKTTKRLIAQLERLGHTVTLEKAAA
jgi:transposase